MTSKELFERARRVIPGGVNSPVRAFISVGGDPVYIVRGKGARIWTAEGKELIDFCGSWGPLILGHAREEVVAAIRQAAEKGTSFGTNNPAEVEFAELLCELVPSMDMVRLVSSGTEAVMTALRLARGYTGRRKVLKFEGCYHGHVDPLLVSAGSGLLTGGIASSSGVTSGVAGDTLVCPFNNLESVEQVAAEHSSGLAAIIVEPIAANMGLVPPEPGFLEGLRRVADRVGALLIFDEVITGFRLAPTTYGNICGVRPDLTCLGKIIGGGLPVGAVGGRAEIMKMLAPLGPVYQAGTLSGNPVALAAGLATLNILKESDPYPALNRLGRRLADGLNASASKYGVPMRCAALGGMFTPFFSPVHVKNMMNAKTCDTRIFAAFFNSMLWKGFYLPPSQFEVAFISAAHSRQDVDTFVNAATDTLREVIVS